jgi:hypothetical protein
VQHPRRQKFSCLEVCKKFILKVPVLQPGKSFSDILNGVKNCRWLTVKYVAPFSFVFDPPHDANL